MQRNHLLTRRSDVSRRWQRAFADGLRISAPDELPDPARAVAGRAPLLWIDFDLFEEIVAREPGAFTDGVASVVVLDPRPDTRRARQALGGRARAYCHACASPVLFRRVAEAVERGELWIGREWSAHLAAALEKSGAAATMR